MKELLKSMLDLFKAHGVDLDGSTEPEVEEKEEEMVSIEVVYEPDTKDAHEQWMSKSTLIEACDSFNKGLESGVVKSNLFHIQDTELFTVEDTWINKELDVIVKDSGEPIKAGSWLAKVKYHDKDLWQLRKDNIIQGVSIGCKAEVNEETGEITNVTFDWGDTE